MNSRTTTKSTAVRQKQCACAVFFVNFFNFFLCENLDLEGNDVSLFVLDRIDARDFNNFLLLCRIPHEIRFPNPKEYAQVEQMVLSALGILEDESGGDEVQEAKN